MEIGLFAEACERPSASLNVQRTASAARVIAAKRKFGSVARPLAAEHKREEADSKGFKRVFLRCLPGPWWLLVRCVCA